MTKLNVDCLSLIFNELQTDKISLHSCLLVNKEWCNIVVPILWKKCSWYFLDKRSKVKLYNVILSCLPSSSRQFLFDNDIKLPSTIFLKSPLFDYVNFCKFPRARIIGEIVKMVFEEEFNMENFNKQILEQEIYKLFVSQCENIKELSWKTSQPLPQFPGASTCFSQLHSLYIDVEVVNSNDLCEMAQICKDLNDLVIYECYQDVPGLISLIDSQRNLKSVTIRILYNDRERTCEELGKALARKSNTISYLYLNSANIIPLSFLKSFINLKHLSIVTKDRYEDTSEEINYFQQCLAILEFPNLEYLHVDTLSCFKELAMIIEKSNGNILEVDIYPYNDKYYAKNTEMLIKAIAKNCPKIEALYTYLEAKDFMYVKQLLLNCRQLKYIYFDKLNDSADNAGDKLLDILTKFSPKSLNKIFISKGWKYSIDAFEKFFESFRERTLYNFGLISCNSEENYITKDHYLIIEKYVREGVITKKMV